MFWITPSVKAGNYHNPSLFHKEEQAIRESMYSCPPPSFFHDRILQRSLGDLLDYFHHGLRKSAAEFRAYVLVVRLRFFSSTSASGSQTTGIVTVP